VPLQDLKAPARNYSPLVDSSCYDYCCWGDSNPSTETEPSTKKGQKIGCTGKARQSTKIWDRLTIAADAKEAVFV